ncbi:hypothetical protein HYH02_012181 [Chlamydomonas schloesseri]|uniref:Uncharacterized protein n=1 Tax=Chlamydomonas schloesseri TaxID=2026947 RepID=A0A835SWI9_9CHLO|nr:hypothetical protein HYH02_012181 [Chlamydomonas schloesseri]|eukprot:KAG2434514.1 hypothetical protein HYH02_012181 [Chlamydomonas schloesseri]
MSMDRGARPSMDAHAGGAMAKARMSMDRAARPSDASAGGRQGRQAVSAAAHRKAPVLPARRGADPGGRATAEHADAPTAESREGLQQRRSRIARYSSGAEYGLGPDSALVRSERSEVLSVAALTALRYSCTSASFTTTTKDFHCNQGKAAAERQPLQRKAGAAAAAAAVPSMGNRAISAPIPLADPLAAPPSSAAPFQPTSSRTAAAALLAAARSSGGRYSRASDADSEASYARRSNSSGNGNGNGNNGRQVDTEFLMRLDEALSSGALRPDQATRLLRDVGFDLDQLLVDELSSK